MKTNTQDISLSLAAVVQSTMLVSQVASEGRHPQDAYETSISSIFSLSANSMQDIYGHPSQLDLGVENLKRLLSQKKHGLTDVLKYTACLLHLEKRLNKNDQIKSKLQNRIQQAEQQAGIFSPTHTNVIANLADIYKDTISNLGPKILISGDPGLLQNPEIANKIRALLLAGIRAAVLWRQLGGSRWQLFFGKQKILKALDEIEI